jgi:uncharacterized protein (TIGR02147 family)
VVTVYEFNSYKEFVREWVRTADGGPRGQYLKMAKSIRVHTTTISQIFQQEKDLTLEQAHLLTDHLGLNALESRYFMSLVQMGRAGTADLKSYFANEAKLLKAESELIKNRVVKGERLSAAQRAIFYSQWYYAAIHLLTDIPDLQTPEALSAATELSLKRVREVLEFLENSGLCTVVEGRYKPSQLRTHIDKGSPLAARHHTNWRLRSIESIETMTERDLAFTAPLTISAGDAGKIKSLILQFIEDATAVIADSPSEEGYCLNIDWFKISAT